MKNDVFMLHLLLSLLRVCERVVKSGIKKALDFSRTEALKTAKMEVKIEVPLLSKVVLLRPLSTALFPAFA